MMLRSVCDTTDDKATESQDGFCTPNALSSVLTARRGCCNSSRDAQQAALTVTSGVKARLHVSQVVYHIGRVLLDM